MNIRNIVLKEIRRRGWSAYRLAKEAGVPMRSIQRYIAGEADIRTDRLGKLLDALALRIVKGGK